MYKLIDKCVITVMIEQKEPKRRERKTTAVRNKQEVDRQGWITGRQGYQQLGRQMSTQGGWQAGTGLVILGQGEHRDHEQDKTCSI